jgi:hypothetical protein
VDPLTHLLATGAFIGRDRNTLLAGIAPDLAFYSTYLSIITTSCAVFGAISNRASNHDIVCSFGGIQVTTHELFPQS